MGNNSNEILLTIIRHKNLPEKDHVLYTDLDELCTGLNMDQTLSRNREILLMHRYRVEWKEAFIQLIVAVVIRCGHKLVLLNAKKGAMKGKLTMVQGHANFNALYRSMTISELLLEEIKRELGEELVIKDEALKDIPMTLKFNTLNNTDPKDIAYYHLGFIYEMNIDESLMDKVVPEAFESNEPEKHDVVVVDIDNELLNMKYDSWLREVIEYYHKELNA